MEELLQPSVEAICMALFGIVERLWAAGMGAALEEAARGFEVFGELAEIGRVVLVAARALDGRAASLLGCGTWRALAIMPCTVPTSEVWTPPAPGAGIRGVRMPAGVRAPAHTARC